MKAMTNVVVCHGAARLLACVTLLLSTLHGTDARAASHVPGRMTTTEQHYAGWAMDAYPGDSTEYLKGEMQRQLGAAANIVWLGHNNPGEVAANKGEPGLSYAVWAAYQDIGSPVHADAVAMVQAQQHALDAARSLGVQVILPIGYQIQMGLAWNQAHLQDERTSADGGVYGPGKGGRSASFYAPQYQHDILAYYHWVENTFVRPYAGTILMLNLADEPSDGDYSSWADAAFRKQYGFGLREAGNDPVRQQTVGRFESDYIADYAAWSATQWQSIDPAMKVTMSFCGGYSRGIHEGPNLESIFRKAPANFVVTFDAYPRDGLYNTSLRESDLIGLFGLIRTLGYYSAVYNRPLWLWSAANSWGLNEASADQGNIADAVANGIYLAQLVRQTGGDLQGIAVWNYNIKGQGLYNDTHHVIYDPDQMFARVSASFPLLRQIMAAPVGTPDTAVLAPNAPVLRQAGAQLALRATDLYQWSALAALARSNVAAVTVSRLDDTTLPGLHTALVLVRAPGDLAAGDRVALLTLLARGGIVVASAPVAASLASRGAITSLLATGGRAPLTVRSVATPLGTLLAVDGGAVEDLFSDANTTWAAPVLAQVLQRSAVTGGYLVSAGGVTLLYSIAHGGSSMSLDVPSGQAAVDLAVYDTHGQRQQTIHLAGRHGAVRVFIARRSYALLPVLSAQPAQGAIFST